VVTVKMLLSCAAHVTLDAMRIRSKGDRLVDPKWRGTRICLSSLYESQQRLIMNVLYFGSHFSGTTADGVGHTISPTASLPRCSAFAHITLTPGIFSQWFTDGRQRFLHRRVEER